MPHAPAPWTRKGLTTIIDRTGEYVATVHGRSVEEIKDTSCLIAHAPVLLHTAEYVLLELTRMDAQVPDITKCAKLLAAAVASSKEAN
jgi:hypothetical protein